MTDYAFEHAVWQMQRHFHDHVLQPLITAEIERSWEDGSLPLPPLGWGRTEPWAVGDLR